MTGEHAWFAEHMAAAVCGGLVGTESTRFETHRQACPECARAYAELAELDRRTSAVLAGERPAAGLEDRIIQHLRASNPSQHSPVLRIPRTFGRLVTGLAATVLLGAIGYFGSAGMNGGAIDRLLSFDLNPRQSPRAASNLRQLSNAAAQYAQANNIDASLFLLLRSQDINSEVFTVPSADSDRDSYSGGTRANFSDLKKNLSYSVRSMFPDTDSRPSGFKWNDSLNPDFAVMDDKNGKAPGASAAREKDGQNVLHGEGHVDFVRDKWSGVGKDNIYSRSEMDANDSILLPTEEDTRVGDGPNPNAPKLHLRGVKVPEGRVMRNGVQQSNENVDGTITHEVQDLQKKVPNFTNAPDFNLSTNGTATGTRSYSDWTASDGGYIYQPGNTPAPASGKAGEAFKPGQLLVADPKRYDVAGTTADALDKTLQERSEEISKLQAELNTSRAMVARDGPAGETSAVTPTTPATPPPPAQTRKIIRSGEMEFEVESFDSAAARIERIATEDGGFIATVNSERLGNGKMKGAVVVRIPPDRLDGFVQMIRALGDLRSQRIGSQDVSKQYTDTESELKACRAMEGRLLEIIKTGKGEVKDLVAAEKELGEWRVRIEKLEGEIRYMSNLIAMSTLTISLLEKDIQQAARAVETETVNMGVETEDVEAAFKQVVTSIHEAKGRIVDSKLNRHDAGQLSATITADMPRDAAGPMIDRLKQIGRVGRFDRTIAQTTVEGATVRPGGVADLKVERKETRLVLSLYNLANVAPRQTYNIDLAVEDVEAVYRKMTARPMEAAAGGRVVTSNLTRPKADQVTGAVNFEVKSAAAEEVLKDIRQAGQVLRLTLTENPDTANVTTAKQGFVLQIVSVASVPPRQSTGISLAVKDVPAAHNKLVEVAAAQGARVIQNQLNEADRQNITSAFDFELAKEKAGSIDTAIAAAGDTVSRSTQRVAESEVALETKVRYRVSMAAADRLPAREQTAVQINVADVNRSREQVLAAANDGGARIIENQLQEAPGGRSTARVLFDLPLGSSLSAISKITGLGNVAQRQIARNSQAPDGPLARARIEVLLTAQPILNRDDGLMSQLREGLSTSVRGLLLSLRLVIIGICLVAPIALTLWLVWRLILRRMFRKPAKA